MDIFNIISGIASIIGLLISISSLIISCYTLNKIINMDSSKTNNKVSKTTINGDYVGRDRK